ncbi:MAG: sensor histidine kinase [Gemmiger sp.]
MKQPESMARKIRRCLMLMGVLSVVLTVVIMALLFQRAQARSADRSLERICESVSAGYTACGGGPDSLDTLIPGDGLRFTLISPDGTVAYDNVAVSSENHLSRPEVRDALETGCGSATRRSATRGYETHYYALRLADGSVLRAADEVTNIWGAYNNLLPMMLLSGVLVLVLALFLSYRFTRRLVGPVNRMAEHLDTIDADVPYEELIPLATTIQSDRKLRENNEAMRREFTANVSHELKTPLTSISGYAELIENGMARPEDIPLFAARIHKETKRMIALVSDIIQLSELDGMRGESSAALEFSPLDLSEVVKDVAANMTMNARKAYITLQCHADPVTVRGNHDQLTELVTNLCDNAIRYNRPGGHVLLRCGTEPDGSPCLTVEDNGIGIPKESQARVFERFYRVDKSRSKATGGTGLGLAIVKHIAMLHSARIDLKSQVGTGTCVKVVFPKG